MLDRRQFLVSATAALTTSAGPLIPVHAQPSQAQGPFDAQQVLTKAQQLSASAYQDPDQSLPKELQELNYDAYRGIRFRPDHALWRGEGLPFEVQFFHRGFLFVDRVRIHEVRDGVAAEIPYSPDLFSFDLSEAPPRDSNVGFAGFRLHAPINRSDYYDEVGIFLGASYFRAVARGQSYGLSARGLSIGTADQKGEEFPAFREFWIERPEKQSRSIIVHALLDSKSATGAYRFTITPGETTSYRVELTLFPRVDIAQVGIGTLTSMFFFDANDRVGVDDFRPAVHDSDGLAIQNGRNEEIWRPLANPRDLQISLFADENPRSFGLMQRERRFEAYQDIESRFEKRPSAWIEPIDEWGQGAVQLVEIPTKEEVHDNIVTFWRPKEPLRAKRPYSYRYWLDWGSRKTETPTRARFVKTRIGAGPKETRRFVLELAGDELDHIDPGSVRGHVTVDKGEIRNLVLQPNLSSGGLRMSFELANKKDSVVELRAQLIRDDKPISEVWLYRWSP